MNTRRYDVADQGTELGSSHGSTRRTAEGRWAEPSRARTMDLRTRRQETNAKKGNDDMHNRPGLAKGRKMIARVHVRQRITMKSSARPIWTSPTKRKTNGSFTLLKGKNRISKDFYYREIKMFCVVIGENTVVCCIRGLRHSLCFFWLRWVCSRESWSRPWRLRDVVDRRFPGAPPWLTRPASSKTNTSSRERG
jgi:hypothetical protein